MLDAEVQAVLDQFDLTVPDVGDLLDTYRSLISIEVAAIIDQRDRGDVVIPVVPFDDVVSGTLDDELRATIRQRGCVIVRGPFERGLAEDWDHQLGEYLDTKTGGIVLKTKDVLATSDKEALQKAADSLDCPVCEILKDGQQVGAIV